MQTKDFISQRKATVALCIVLLMLAQQVCGGPLVPQVGSSRDKGAEPRAVHTARRVARMTPLWRIMNSKPFGAYCQNNYECTTGLCRAGHCSTSHAAPRETVTY